MVIICGPFLGKTKNRGGKDDADDEADDAAEERYEEISPLGMPSYKFAMWCSICIPSCFQIVARNNQGHDNMAKMPTSKYTLSALARKVVTPPISETNQR